MALKVGLDYDDNSSIEAWPYLRTTEVCTICFFTQLTDQNLHTDTGASGEKGRH